MTSDTRLGELYLIPSLIGDTAVDSSLPSLVRTVVSRLSHFVVEEEKTARRFIKLICPDKVIRDLNIQCLNEHTKREELTNLIAPLRAGIDIGIVSEAGCPAIADPGSDLVALAHEIGARVHPLVGPCSMILALMASGFHGQRWRFVGYVPIEEVARRSFIRALEEAVHSAAETQILMDTPYRNQKLLEDLLNACRPETKVCVASALTTEAESIRVRSVKEWKASGTRLEKVPTIFLLGR